MMKKLIAGMIIAVGLVLMSAPPALAQESPGFFDRLFGTGRAQVDASKAVDVAGIEAANAVTVANIEADAGARIAEIDQRAREAIARAENDASLAMADRQERIEQIKASAGQMMEAARANADVSIAEADANARMYLSDNRVEITELEGETSLALADKAKDHAVVQAGAGIMIALAIALGIVAIVLAFRKTPQAQPQPQQIHVFPPIPEYPKIAAPEYTMLADDLTEGIMRGGVLYLPADSMAQSVSAGDD